MKTDAKTMMKVGAVATGVVAAFIYLTKRYKKKQALRKSLDASGVNIWNWIDSRNRVACIATTVSDEEVLKFIVTKITRIYPNIGTEIMRLKDGSYSLHTWATYKSMTDAYDIISKMRTAVLMIIEEDIYGKIYTKCPAIDGTYAYLNLDYFTISTENGKFDIDDVKDMAGVVEINADNTTKIHITDGTEGPDLYISARLLYQSDIYKMLISVSSREEFLNLLNYLITNYPLEVK